MGVAADEDAGCGGLPIRPAVQRAEPVELEAVIGEQSHPLDAGEADRQQRQITPNAELLTDRDDAALAVRVPAAHPTFARVSARTRPRSSPWNRRTATWKRRIPPSACAGEVRSTEGHTGHGVRTVSRVGGGSGW